MKLEDIDKLFKQKEGEFNKHPGDQLWNRLEAKLEGEENLSVESVETEAKKSVHKTTPLWHYLAAACITFTFLAPTVWYTYNQSNTDSVTMVNKANHSKTAPESRLELEELNKTKPILTNSKAGKAKSELAEEKLRETEEVADLAKPKDKTISKRVEVVPTVPPTPKVKSSIAEKKPIPINDLVTTKSASKAVFPTKPRSVIVEANSETIGSQLGSGSSAGTDLDDAEIVEEISSDDSFREETSSLPAPPPPKNYEALGEKEITEEELAMEVEVGEEADFVESDSESESELDISPSSAESESRKMTYGAPSVSQASGAIVEASFSYSRYTLNSGEEEEEIAAYSNMATQDIILDESEWFSADNVSGKDKSKKSANKSQKSQEANSKNEEEYSIPIWLEGAWMATVGDANIYEEWSFDSYTNLKGQAYTMANGINVYSEDMSINSDGSSLAYQISSINNTVAPNYSMLNQANNLISFESKEFSEEYPKYIIYKLLTESSLQVIFQFEMAGKKENRSILLVKTE